MSPKSLSLARSLSSDLFIRSVENYLCSKLRKNMFVKAE